MKTTHRRYSMQQARKRLVAKWQRAPDINHTSGHHQESLYRQIAKLRKDILNLRRNAKIAANEKLCFPVENHAESNKKKQHAEQKDRSNRLAKANAKLIISALALQVAVDKIEHDKTKMTHLANYDFLTDLPNRMQLYEKINLAIEWAKRHRARMALLFLDIDHFKQINDSLGHAVGDKLLQSIAHRLKGVVRSTDTVSRLGGDEFVLLLSEFDQEINLISKIENIQKVIAVPYDIESYSISVSASIGVSLYPEHGVDADTLILNADSAMYHAKKNGRNRFYFFKQEMRNLILSQQVFEKNIYAALKNQQFELLYQAQFDLQNGAVTGVEALIRWHHPVSGVLLPGFFMPTAEECGAIIPIGRWVLHEACRQAKAWVDDGLDFNVIAINISVREFDDHEFLDNIFQVLRDTGLEPSRLELELTETVLMKNIQATTIILQALRAIGIKISIDDFGTGYSSLSYLKQIPFDTMKIDQSFVNDILLSSDDVLVKAIIAIGKNLHRKVIAEGVETLEQLDFLRKNECEAAQGFCLHFPMPGREFTGVLKQRLLPGSLH